MSNLVSLKKHKLEKTAKMCEQFGWILESPKPEEPEKKAYALTQLGRIQLEFFIKNRFEELYKVEVVHAEELKEDHNKTLFFMAYVQALYDSFQGNLLSLLLFYASGEDKK